MEVLLTVTTDVFEVPTFYLKSCALLILFNFCTDSENIMGKKIPPPRKEHHHHHHPTPRKPKPTKPMYLSKKSSFFLILGNHSYLYVYINIHICVYVHCVFLIKLAGFNNAQNFLFSSDSIIYNVNFIF